MKFALSLILASLSLSAFSASITCEVAPLLTNNIGLYPGEELFLTAKVGDDMNGCSRLEKYGQELEFCANEDDIIGIYSISFVAVEPGHMTYSTAFHGVSRSTLELQRLKSETEIIGSLYKKIDAADISIPSSLDRGDSVAVDEAVKQAFLKNIVKKDEIVAFQINSCKLSK